MSKDKGTFKERYAASYKRITSSPEFKRSEDARIIRRRLILPYLALAVVTAYLGTKLFHIPEYISYGLSVWVAIVLAYMIADKKSAKN